jgi:hypothetical protein
MNIEMILAQPLAETFLIDGRAANVLAAHNMAWDGFKAFLAGDPEEAWSLKVMNHAWESPEAITFHAEFVRNPNFENEVAD